MILVLLGLIIYYFLNQKDAKGQIDDFKAAVEDRNYSEISKLLSTNSQKISETDAKHFVDYINKIIISVILNKILSKQR